VGDEPELIRPVLPRFVRWFIPSEEYVWIRFAILRLLALVYLTAFLVTARQFRPLIGAHGLYPAQTFLTHVLHATGSRWNGFVKLPTIFWLGCSDGAISAVAWLGVGISALVLAGATNALLQFLLWAMYLSIAQVGGKFYGYGWESQLCETGFLAILLCPVRTIHPIRATAPPRVVIVLFRFLIVRIMLGAGLIKMRGDDCWRDLTCLVYHYETQPNPNPLARWLHAMPVWFHKIGVAFNHFVELGAPWFAFGPRRVRLVAGGLFVVFQVSLILSGNLSFLNWLTIVPAIACFDDRLFTTRSLSLAAPSFRHSVGAGVAAGVLGFLSIQPIANLFSRFQIMNRGYDPLRLVNTYGAFGSVSRERFEIVLQGTSDEEITESTKWLEYELPCKPGDVTRRPCIVSPYHYRLDWQLWFCGFRDLNREPWLAYLAFKLLRGEHVPLFAKDPFPSAPPKWIRARVYWYRFTKPGDPVWWKRDDVGEYLAPVGRDDPDLVFFLRAHELLRPDEP
jgi:hypothetical protein